MTGIIQPNKRRKSFHPYREFYPTVGRRMYVSHVKMQKPKWFYKDTNNLNIHVYNETAGKQVTCSEKQQEILIVGNIGETEKLQEILISNHAAITGDSNMEKQGAAYISQWTKKTTLVNSSNMPACVKLYKLKPRKDIPLSYVNSTSDGYTTTETFDALVKVLFDDNNTGTYYQNFGVKPTDAKQLMSKFKIVQSKSMVISPGDSISVKTGTYYHRLKGDNFTKDGVFAFKKLTEMWLVILQGTIAHDATTETEIGTAGARLDILEETRCSTYLADTVQGTVSYTNSMGTLAAGAEQWVQNAPEEKADDQ